MEMTASADIERATTAQKAKVESMSVVDRLNLLVGAANVALIVWLVEANFLK